MLILIIDGYFCYTRSTRWQLEVKCYIFNSFIFIFQHKTLQPWLVLRTSRHTSFKQHYQPSVFIHTTSTIPLWPLQPTVQPLHYLLPSFPQAMDEWDSSCLSVFTQCREGGWGGFADLLLVSRSVSLCQIHIPPLFCPASPASVKQKQSTFQSFLFSFHFSGSHSPPHCCYPAKNVLLYHKSQSFSALTSVLLSGRRKILDISRDYSGKRHQKKGLNVRYDCPGWMCMSCEMISCVFRLFSFMASELLMGAHHEQSLTLQAVRVGRVSACSLITCILSKWETRIHHFHSGQQPHPFVWRHNYLQTCVTDSSAAWR